MENLSAEELSDQEHFLSAKLREKEKKNIFTPVELIYIFSLLSQHGVENKQEGERNIIDHFIR